MAAPITQSLFKPTDFDLFLDEIGYEDLAPRDRIALADRFTQAVEYALVTRIFRLLPRNKQTDLVSLMQKADKSGDETAVNEFLFEQMPEIETIVDETIEEVKNMFRASTGSVNESVERTMAMLQLQNQSPRDYRASLGIEDVTADTDTPDTPDPLATTPPAQSPQDESTQMDLVRTQLQALEDLPPLPPIPTQPQDNPLADELDSLNKNS